MSLKIIAALSLTATVLLAGCSAGVTANVDFSSQQYAAKVHYDNPGLRSVVSIQNFKVDRGVGISRVQATLVNNSYFSKSIEYRINWVDSSGFVVNPGSQPWTPAHLHGKEHLQVQSTAPNADAQDFNISVRKLDN